MKEELQLINQRLDHLAKELATLKAAIAFRANISPPLSIREAAAYLQLSRSRVYDLVYSGKLQPLQHRKRGRILFSKESLQNYLYGKE